VSGLQTGHHVTNQSLGAARIVTGLTVYSNRDSLHQETGWGKLPSRQERKKLCLMHNT